MLMIPVISPYKLATCKLCGLQFNRGTEGRSVTAHTLLQLKEHLKLRGIHLTINFKVKAKEFLSHAVAVCEICYSVAIAEYHLMNAERRFAKVQGIPVKEQNVSIDIGKSRGKILAEKIAKPVLPSTLLYQWRVLFYFRNIIGSMQKLTNRFRRNINTE